MLAHHLFARYMEQSRPQEDNELFDIFVEIKPIGKERPRAGHSTPIKTRTWTDYVGACVAEQMAGKPAITFPVCARIVYAIEMKRLPDMDNVEKAVWDALQRGDKSGKHRALQDDRMVRGYVEKCEMPGLTVLGGMQFIWIRFYARRAEDAINYMREYERVDSDNGYL